MIDTHCHLNWGCYSQDLDTFIDTAKSFGVSHMITIGCDAKSSEEALLISQKYKNVFPTVGIHPSDWKKYRDQNEKEKIEHLIQEHEKKIVGFGETGFDYYRLEASEVDEAKKYQKEMFLAHIKWGNIYKKPLVIHCREAEDDTVTLLKEHNFYKAVFHCFGQDLSFAKKVLDLPNTYISFSGIITFKNAHNIREALEYVPLEKIMIETDSPFLAPEPYRGETNQPAYVRFVLEKVAEVKKISPKDLENILHKNTKEFWEITI